jgi:hypothetical protein
MPLYELVCLACNHVQDALIGIAELADRDPLDLDLSDLNIACAKCGTHKFSKLLSAHGKTAHNWSGWQRR